MSQTDSIRILLIGRTLPVQAIDCLRGVSHAVHYTCVENLAAAEWLMTDGYDAELIIAEAGLYRSARHIAAWREQNGAGMFLAGTACDFAALKPRLSVLLDICRLRRIPMREPGFDRLLTGRGAQAPLASHLDG